MEGPLGLDIDHAGQPIIAPLHRGLKGGWGGGGGGWGGGGGGGWGHGRGSWGHGGGNRNHGTGSDTGAGDSVWILGAVVAAVVLFVICACCWRSPTSKPGKHGSDEGFDEAVDLARAKTNDATNVSAEPAFESYEGDFTMKYIDRNNVHNVTAKICLKSTGAGTYKIEGEANDADGTATITEGCASISGQAWWIEETIQEDFKMRRSTLKVLTEETFDFTNNTFLGTWRADNGIKGRYVNVVGRNVNKTYSTRGLGQVEEGMASATPTQTLQEMLQDDMQRPLLADEYSKP